MPMHGITSRTPLYQLADTPTRPLSPFLYKTWAAAQREARVAPKPILEACDSIGL